MVILNVCHDSEYTSGIIFVDVFAKFIGTHVPPPESFRFCFDDLNDE